nr:MAG TPA: hypothetical protein [Caudoviricetes sp.]
MISPLILVIISMNCANLILIQSRVLLVLTVKPKSFRYGNTVLTTKVICCSSVTSMDEPSQ